VPRKVHRDWRGGRSPGKLSFHPEGERPRDVEPGDVPHFSRGLNTAAVALLWVLVAPRWAHASASTSPESTAVVTDKCLRPGPSSPNGEDPHRFELAGFPVLGGNSDIGFQFGVAGTLTRYCGAVEPYLWNIDLVLSASARDDAGNVHLVQQSHVLRLDAPDLWNGRLRLDGRLSYQRTINEGYYGLGDASTATLSSGESSFGHEYEFIQEEARARFILHFRTGTPFEVIVGGNFRYELVTTYPGSKLAEDGAARLPNGAPLIRGLAPTFLSGLAIGAYYDTRDSEFITTKGLFYQVGVGGMLGTADGVFYGNASAVLAHYVPIKGPFLFAERLMGSVEFGQVPFYDLQQAGTFEPQQLFGGESGVRGVPDGRYAGKIMALSNTEIRTRALRFYLFKQHLGIGATTFFDFGRVWSDFKPNPQLDGKGAGLKYGVGGGIYLQWGEAAIFRIEAAYSPDAVSENPKLPVGIYVSDGLMF
jgi:hypothetical protein